MSFFEFNTRGRLVVLEPFVSDDNLEREVQAVGQLARYEKSIIFYTEQPFDWAGTKSRLLAMAPRYCAWEELLRDPTYETNSIVQGGLWSGRDLTWPVAFIGQYYPQI